MAFYSIRVLRRSLFVAILLSSDAWGEYGENSKPTYLPTYLIALRYFPEMLLGALTATKLGKDLLGAKVLRSSTYGTY